MKIHTVGAELFHADREADITKLTVAFRNFANAPKKWGLVTATQEDRSGLSIPRSLQRI